MSEDEKKKNVKVEIVVDNKATEKLVSILEKEREEKAKAEPDLADLKIQAIQKFGRPDLFLQADTKEKLNAILTSYINELAERANPTQKPSGSAPANDFQYGRGKEDLYTRKFLDSAEMVSELRRLAHEGTPQERADSEHYLNELWKKYILDKRSQPTRSEPSVNSNSPESLLELDLVQRDGFLTPRNKEDGDAQKLQKAWREARKRKMENQL